MWCEPSVLQQDPTARQFSAPHRTSRECAMSRALARALQRAGGVCAMAEQQLATTSSSVSDWPMQQAAQASTAASTSGDWTTRVTEQFSVQPSYFSPLYATYRLHAEKDIRRQLAAKLLQVHSDLANEVEGLDAAQITAVTQHRVREMQRLSDELRALSQASNLPSCTSRKLSLGFYSLLEEESMGRDADAEAFHATLHSQGGNIWDHWQKHFAAPYASTPGLAPLHVVYSRQDLAAAAGQQGAAAAAGSATQQDGASRAEAARRNPPMHASLSADGVARSVGKRKSSTAQVSMVPGNGRIIINDQPYDDFLKDPGLRLHALRPFFVTGTMGRYDVVARVSGGGPSAMAQAVQHGIAQALTVLFGSRKELKGMVLRDIRRVERKKPGRVKARKGFAYVRR